MAALPGYPLVRRKSRAACSNQSRKACFFQPIRRINNVFRFIYTHVRFPSLSTRYTFTLFLLDAGVYLKSQIRHLELWPICFRKTSCKVVEKPHMTYACDLKLVFFCDKLFSRQTVWCYGAFCDALRYDNFHNLLPKTC